MRITVAKCKAGQEPGERKVFDLPDLGLTSISSALQYAARHFDPTLGYYLSCRRGMCAACVVRANGKIEMACVTPVKDGMVIEPVKRDLVVADTVVDLSMTKDATFPLDEEPAGEGR